MDDKTLTTFRAISNFLSDLKSLFKNDKALALYDRLIEKTTFRDEEAVKRHISVFEKFVTEYKEDIIERKDFPLDTEIVYRKMDNMKIYIAIGEFLNKAAPLEKASIQKHLLTICAIFFPEERVIESLESKMADLNIDTSTNEGEFIQNIMEQAKGVVKESVMDNPATAISALFSSGIIQNMATGLQQQEANGQLDIGKLFGALQGAAQSMMSQSGPRVEEM